MNYKQLTSMAAMPIAIPPTNSALLCSSVANFGPQPSWLAMAGEH